MKPTFRTSPVARHGESRPQGNTLSKSPAIDWHYRAPLYDGGSSASFPAPSFRKLSDAYFAREARRESRLEGYLFAIIVALGAWPIVMMLLVAARVLQ
jgi:hypothetical protein